MGVAAMPGVPASFGYCQECLNANAHPMWILVSKTATMYDPEVSEDVLAAASDWWREMVLDTLNHLDQSRDDFDARVREAAKAMDQMLAPTIEDELLNLAWGLIVNVGEGDWETQTEDWRSAAGLWRDRYFSFLSSNPGLEFSTTESSAESDIK